MHKWQRQFIGVEPRAALAALRSCETEGEAMLTAKEQELAQAKARIAALKEQLAELEVRAAELEASAQALSTVLCRAEGHALDVLTSAMALQRSEQEKLQSQLQAVLARHVALRDQRAEFASRQLELIEHYLADLPEATRSREEKEIRSAGALA